MGAAAWGPLRWLLLLGGSFFVSAYIGISVLFRMGGDDLAASEAVRGAVAMILSGGVALAWIAVLITSFVPQWRTAALILLGISFVAAMFGPPLVLALLR